MELETYFRPFREGIVGNDKTFQSPYGKKTIVYTDWVASGRLYQPIEERMLNTFGPLVGNTHSESSVTGSVMTKSYHFAHKVIKQHVNADFDDVIITAGSGMTAVINKLQRMLGLRVSEQLAGRLNLSKDLKPAVFITHMEHHSNQTSWLETLADVVVVPPNSQGLVDLQALEDQLIKYQDRALKIGSFTACSNVTGITTPYHEMSKLMHQFGGVCFVDFACSAPYVNINMHPEDPLGKLDAIFFSPHKFLGGPGTPGVLIFDSKLYHNQVPDNPGGGTVEWTNPWGLHRYITNLEVREDGGTPPFLQTIKAALCIRLKEQMGIENLLEREKELVKISFEELNKIPGLHILAGNIIERLGAISFYVDGIHYNLIVKILNDRFGIQVRGGCSCAGTYGHYLFHINSEISHSITNKIDHGDLSQKPGWVRMSLHPTMTNESLYFALDAIRQIVEHIDEWKQDYTYSMVQNEFEHIHNQAIDVTKWFEIKEQNSLQPALKGI